MMRTLAMAAAAAALLLSGCAEDVHDDGTGGCLLTTKVEVHTVRGHDYIVFIQSLSAISALHAESCPCKEAAR